MNKLQKSFIGFSILTAFSLIGPQQLFAHPIEHPIATSNGVKQLLGTGSTNYYIQLKPGSLVRLKGFCVGQRTKPPESTLLSPLAFTMYQGQGIHLRNTLCPDADFIWLVSDKPVEGFYTIIGGNDVP